MNYDEEISDIQNDLLNEMPDKYSKVKGTWLWEIFKAFALKIHELLELLTSASDKLNIEKLEGDELDAYVKQWTDLERKTAQKAAGYIEATGQGVIYAGTLVSNNAFQYEITEDCEVNGTAKIPITAAEAGESGNTGAGTVTKLVTSNSNITSLTNPEAIEGGTDEESDEALRERYYQRLSMPATSGNKAHYIMWATECAGVGGAKATRDSEINNKVNVYICGDDGEEASAETIALVQEYIDPNKNGDGSGTAPVGAICEVFGAGVRAVSLSGDVEPDNTQSGDNTISAIKENALKYLSQVNFKKTELSYARLLDIVINTDGVNDIENFKLNDGYENLICEETEIFRLDNFEMRLM